MITTLFYIPLFLSFTYPLAGILLAYFHYKRVRNGASIISLRKTISISNIFFICWLFLLMPFLFQIIQNDTASFNIFKHPFGILFCSSVISIIVLLFDKFRKWQFSMMVIGLVYIAALFTTKYVFYFSRFN